MLHVADAARHHKTALFVTVNSNFVLAVPKVANVIDCPRVAFGTGKHLCMVSAHGITALIGSEKSITITLFFAIWPRK